VSSVAESVLHVVYRQEGWFNFCVSDMIRVTNLTLEQSTKKSFFAFICSIVTSFVLDYTCFMDKHSIYTVFPYLLHHSWAVMCFCHSMAIIRQFLKV
jgi:hypothetical protein